MTEIRENSAPSVEQFQLCIATGSPQNLFARSSASFAIFCPLLVRGAINFLGPFFPPSRHVRINTEQMMERSQSDTVGGNICGTLRSGNRRYSGGLVAKEATAISAFQTR